MSEHDSVRAIQWLEAGGVRLLDQRHLPGRIDYRDCRSADEVAEAIRAMVVRGAPAIGIAAAYGCVLAAREGDLDRGAATIGAARPTAVNLHWAVQRMRGVAGGDAGEAALLAEARAIHDEDVAANRRMGDLGAALIEPGRAVLTHCNTGSLATGGFGTALGVIRRAWGDGRLSAVYAGETRPWLQGARLTAWELHQDGIPVRLIVEGAAASLLAGGEVGWVIVGADRVAANGDVANKIGTYGLAIMARALGVRFMVVAPTSTLDPAVASGGDIAIETRDPAELLGIQGQPVAPAGVDGWNPVFDVTPADLVDVLVTERGVVHAPDRAKLRRLLAGDAPGAVS